MMNDGLTRRFFAFCIDCTIVSALAMLAFFVWSVFIFDDRNGDYEIFRKMPYVFFYGFALFKDVFGRSAGKLALKLRIVPDDPDAEFLVLRRIARNITFLIWPVEAASIIITGRRLSDKLLGLNVAGDDTEDDANA